MESGVGGEYRSSSFLVDIAHLGSWFGAEVQKRRSGTLVATRNLQIAAVVDAAVVARCSSSKMQQ